MIDCKLRILRKVIETPVIRRKSKACSPIIDLKGSQRLQTKTVVVKVLQYFNGEEWLDVPVIDEVINGDENERTE